LHSHVSSLHYFFSNERAELFFATEKLVYALRRKCFGKFTIIFFAYVEYLFLSSYFLFFILNCIYAHFSYFARILIINRPEFFRFFWCKIQLLLMYAIFKASSLLPSGF